ncbi:surface antigen [Paramagnetospirillum caucaseum]|uniref:Surface antigen n=1 Tax=Paramagnetospirillum caucaseum TaxID=1244869 RepID=M2ZC98_9PROT|nr:surface antigen [Paramagnetospirillum caucaseum]
MIILLAAALFLALPFEANATLQCVTYAREVTGLNLKGDAWKWWEAAQGVYDRGNAPKTGAVLVFKRQGKMSHGHVAVVRGSAGSRVLLVDHANWAPSRTAGRGKVTKAVPVLDVSPKNDWSEVRVWYQPSREYGSRVYKTQGFVYRPGSAVMQASLRGEAPAKAKAAEPAVAAPARKAEPAVQTPAMETPAIVAAPTIVEARAAVPAEIPAAPAVDGDLGKFDARAWAEQA